MMNNLTNPIYNNDLLQHIRANLKRFDWQTSIQQGLTKAAVAVTIVDHRQGSDRFNLPPH